MDDGRKDEEVVGDADVPTGSNEEIAVCSATGSVKFQPKNPPEESVYALKIFFSGQVAGSRSVIMELYVQI